MKQQLVLPIHLAPAVQGVNNSEFNNATNVVDSPANEADDLPFKPVAIPPEGEEVPQLHS